MTSDGTTHPRRAYVIGAVAGSASALFGIGGGIIVVPLLIGALGLRPHAATATSLAAVAPAAISGALAHGILGNLRIGPALLLGLPAAAGASIGTAIKRRVPSRALALTFAALLCIVAAHQLLPTPAAQPTNAMATPIAALVLAGALGGMLGGILGVGGGVVFVPSLTLFGHVTQLQAVGTSLLAMGPAALTGTWRQRNRNGIDWGVTRRLSVGTTVGTIAGAMSATRAPDQVLRFGFAGLTLATAFWMVMIQEAPLPERAEDVSTQEPRR